MRLSPLLAICITFFGTATSFAAAPPMYRMTDLGSGQAPADLNIFGVATGTDSPDGFHLRGWVYAYGRLSDIGTLGGPDAEAFAINDLGKITGTADLSNGNDDAFLFSDGMMKDLGGLGGSYTEGNDVNDFDVVAGDSNLPGDEIYHAFLWENGSFKDLGTFGGSNSLALSINLFGEATGRAELPGFTDDGNPNAHAFIYSHGKMTDISLESSDYGEGAQINNLGEVTGTAHFKNNSEYHAFVYRASQFIDLGTLGGTNSHGYFINSLGQIAGRSTLSPDDDIEDPFASHAVLVNDGTMYDLNGLIDDDDPLKEHVTLNAAYAINDLGVIVGNGVDDHTGLSHGYLLRPVPRRAPWLLETQNLSAKPLASAAPSDLHHRWRGRFSDHERALGRP